MSTLLLAVEQLKLMAATDPLHCQAARLYEELFWRGNTNCQFVKLQWEVIESAGQITQLTERLRVLGAKIAFQQCDESAFALTDEALSVYTDCKVAYLYRKALATMIRFALDGPMKMT